MAYSIKFDSDSLEAIETVSYRYAWSDILSCYQPSVDNNGNYVIELSESETWQLVQAIQSDDGFLPCLSPNSVLYNELYKLINSVV